MSITFNEYMEKTGDTAVYPRRGYREGLMYVALGLVNEAAEFEVTVDDILGEAGDVMYYAAEIFNHFGDVDVDALILHVDREYNDALHMSALAAEVAGLVKKVWRDGDLSEEKVRSIFGYTASVIAEVEAVVKFYDYSLSDVLQYNLDKLASRKERGVLHGSGGNR